jgi:acyl carrier protein
MRYRDNARELLDPSLRGNGRRKSTPTAAAASSDSAHAELRALVAKSVGVPDENIRDASSLRDLGVNSLDLVVLVMAIEEKFRIEFDPSDLERLRTFDDLARRVGELKAAR